MWALFIIMGIILIGITFYGNKYRNIRNLSFTRDKIFKVLLYTFGSFFIIFGILWTSFYITPGDHIALLRKKYGKELAKNRVIAINGERGRQSWVLQEGLTFSPFINVLYDITNKEYINIEEGKVGLLTAFDGTPLGKDIYIAPDWVPENMENKRDSIEMSMLDPENFIKNNGKKGPQLNVLKPGKYKINTYMWNVDIQPATRIPDGFVGVIISRVGKVPDNIQITNIGNKLATPVVDKGYMGVWKDVLKPGMYYLNTHIDKNKGAYEVKLIETRVQTWTYKGGYSYYTIDLSIDESGKIIQDKSEIKVVKKPSNAVDNAIRAISKDSWSVIIDGRLLIQVEPFDAPYIVSSVGGLSELRDKIMTPLMRSVSRNVAEKRNATTFVWERSVIEQIIDSLMKIKSNGSKLTVKEFKMNNVYIKPELLVPDKRKQLAIKMKDTYEQEKLAYDEKIKTEKAREEAKQQGVLVKAKIAYQSAEQYKKASQQEGIGKKLKMIEIAKGQERLRDVFGVDKAFALEIVKNLKELPDNAFQVPFSYNGGLNSDPFSFLNLNQMIDAAKKMGVDPKPVK
jgi:hypothetical protein